MFSADATTPIGRPTALDRTPAAIVTADRVPAHVDPSTRRVARVVELARPSLLLPTPSLTAVAPLPSGHRPMAAQDRVDVTGPGSPTTLDCNSYAERNAARSVLDDVKRRVADRISRRPYAPRLGSALPVPEARPRPTSARVADRRARTAPDSSAARPARNHPPSEQVGPAASPPTGDENSVAPRRRLENGGTRSAAAGRADRVAGAGPPIGAASPLSVDPSRGTLGAHAPVRHAHHHKCDYQQLMGPVPATCWLAFASVTRRSFAGP